MSGRHSKQGWARSRLLLRIRRLFVFSAAVGAVFYFTLISDPELMTIILSVLLIAGLGSLVWLLTRQPELSVVQRAGATLDGLSDAGFVVLHDVRLGQRWLEYVVIGPPGVSVVRTQPASKATLNRESPDMIGETLKELQEDVACLSSHTETRVVPLLVTVEELDVEVPNKGETVYVERLAEFLRGQPNRLDEPTVRDTVIEVLRATTAGSTTAGERTEKGVSSA